MKNNINFKNIKSNVFNTLKNHNINTNERHTTGHTTHCLSDLDLKVVCFVYALIRYFLISLFSLYLGCSVIPVQNRERAYEPALKTKLPEITYELIFAKSPSLKSYTKTFMQEIQTQGNFKKLVGKIGNQIHARFIFLYYPYNVLYAEQSYLENAANIGIRQLAKESSFIFPIIIHRRRLVVIEIWKRKKKIKVYKYHSKYFLSLGLLSVLGIPWSNSKFIENDFKDIVYQFFEDVQKDKLF